MENTTKETKRKISEEPSLQAQKKIRQQEDKGKEPVRESRGDEFESIKAVMLVGLPGTGKTVFGKQLATAEGGSKFSFLNQGEIGKRTKLEKRLVAEIKEKKVIIDRCNVTLEERQNWLKVANLKASEVLLVFFETKIKVCCDRIAKRKDHPTIPSGTSPSKIKKIVFHFVKQLSRPSESEGYFSIVNIRNFKDCDNLLARFGVGPVVM